MTKIQKLEARIKKLEKEIEKLKAEPKEIHYHYGYSYYPSYPVYPCDPNQPIYITDGTRTDGNSSVTFTSL